VTAALGEAVARLRARRGRSLIAALGIAAAATMIGTAVTLSFGLSTGAERAAQRSDLPDVTARFERRTRAQVDERIGALANVEDRSYRLEIEGVALSSDGGSSREGVAQLVPRGGAATPSSRAAT